MNLISPRTRRAAGFTLNEVLVSLGILAIGITAVAALFPSGILMQKRAVKEALFQQNTRSAEALLQAKGVSANTLFRFSDNISGQDSSNTDIFPSFTLRDSENIPDAEFDVFALAEVDIRFVAGNPAENVFRTNMRKGSYGPSNPSDPTASEYSQAESLLQYWPETDRSFPSIEPDPADREFFYVPLFRRGPQATEYINDWVVYVFVMQAQPEIDDPGSPAGSQPKYPSDPESVPNTADNNQITVPVGTICANPFDNEDYFPKVFRAPIEVASSTATTTRYRFDGGWDSIEKYLRLGDMVLGDNGEIYRVGDVDPSDGALGSFTLNLAPRQQIDALATSKNDKLNAIWFAMPPNTPEVNPPSPIRDIRVLSRSAVRIGDYE